MADPRTVNLAKILVHYSTRVQPKDRVMISGAPLEPVASPLVREVYRQVLLAGAYPHVSMTPAGIRHLFFDEANEDQLKYVDPFRKMVVEEFEVSIRISAEFNRYELNNIDPEKVQTYRKADADLFKISNERIATGDMRWVGTRYPSQAMAQEAEMSLEEYEDFYYRCTFADKDDPVTLWMNVQKRQEKLIDWLKGKKQVVLKGPDIDLSLSIEGRPFIDCSGQENMPDGEIFTSPVEESVNGWVRFSFPALVYGREIQGVELTFEGGKVVEASAEKNQDFLTTILDTDAGSRYIGEWGIGTNTQIDRFTRSMLFDEKIGGTIHFALGAGFPESGSKNESAIHWDLLCDMREGGQISVDDELFYDSGEFIL